MNEGVRGGERGRAHNAKEGRSRARTSAVPEDSAISIREISASISRFLISSFTFFLVAASNALFSSERSRAPTWLSFFRPSFSSPWVMVPSSPPNDRNRSCILSPLSFMSFSSFSNTPPTRASIFCAAVSSWDMAMARRSSPMVRSPSPEGSATFISSTTSFSLSSRHLGEVASFSFFCSSNIILMSSDSFFTPICDGRAKGSEDRRERD
jgi:hypothetical protein